MLHLSQDPLLWSGCLWAWSVILHSFFSSNPNNPAPQWEASPTSSDTLLFSSLPSIPGSPSSFPALSWLQLFSFQSPLLRLETSASIPCLKLCHWGTVTSQECRGTALYPLSPVTVDLRWGWHWCSLNCYGCSVASAGSWSGHLQASKSRNLNFCVGLWI